ncbi:MAG TPA: amidophosphoribosyltransferase [Candidatus Methylacidiphilales bacterium]|nr:amidophosphoribosyltransferase [Candidatus Methylacidiphilales bacterium]
MNDSSSPAGDLFQHRPKDECGVFAVYGHPQAAEITFFGLYALQHRGQESAGIVVASDKERKFKSHHGMGLVSQVFNEKELAKLPGNRSIGHVRYSTTGSSTLENAQPIVADCSRGQIAVGHNGNLVNANLLRDELEAKGAIFKTTVDSEVILHLMAQPTNNLGDSILIQALCKVRGAFSLVLMSEREVIGVRDSLGFRPLCIGKVDNAWLLSSESCAFDIIPGAKFVRDVEPGEIVVIDENGLRSYKPFVAKDHLGFCIFEYVYFARPDSTIEGVNVSAVRTNMGRELARLHPVEADLVIPVPDSGNYAALGFSEESGIPYDHAFVRNHYVGRTFLNPSQLAREFGVRVKLNIIKERVAGKRVVVVDDSIVRGTTARTRVMNLRNAGAKEVHIRISCPPHRFPCHYGIDFPDPADLIANQLSHQEITKYLQADSLGYLDTAGMVRATGRGENKFCMACFNQKYPVPVNAVLDKLIFERRRERADSLIVAEDTAPRLFNGKR